MAKYGLAFDSDQGKAQRPRRPQGIYDPCFRLTAVGQGFEGRGRKGVYRLCVLRTLLSDLHLELPELENWDAGSQRTGFTASLACTCDKPRRIVVLSGFQQSLT